MSISLPENYREAARIRLPGFLLDYIDGGVVTEKTMKNNVMALQNFNLRQQVLSGAGTPMLSCEIMKSCWGLPVTLEHVGATDMYARRGEVHAARAVGGHHIPYTQSTVSVCPIEEAAVNADGEQWTQLYVLRDRSYMHDALERAWAAGGEAGVTNLLNMLGADLSVTMTLIGANKPSGICRDNLDPLIREPYVLSENINSHSENN